MDKLDPQLTAFLFRLVTIFIGIFGSVVVGILAFFLKSLVTEQKKADTELREGLNDVKIKIETNNIKLTKDLEFMQVGLNKLEDEIEEVKDHVDRKLTGFSWKKKKRAY